MCDNSIFQVMYKDSYLVYGYLVNGSLIEIKIFSVYEDSPIATITSDPYDPGTLKQGYIRVNNYSETGDMDRLCEEIGVLLVRRDSMSGDIVR